MLRWFARRREISRLAEMEATNLIEGEGAAGYYSARSIARKARAIGDRDAARRWSRIARIVVARTGLQPGRSKIGRPDAEW